MNTAVAAAASSSPAHDASARPAAADLAGAGAAAAGADELLDSTRALVPAASLSTAGIASIAPGAESYTGVRWSLGTVMGGVPALASQPSHVGSSVGGTSSMSLIVCVMQLPVLMLVSISGTR